MIWQGHYNSNSQEFFITSHRAPIVGKPFIKPTPTDRLLYQVCEYHYWLCAAYFQVGKLTRLMTCNVSQSLLQERSWESKSGRGCRAFNRQFSEHFEGISEHGIFHGIAN